MPTLRPALYIIGALLSILSICMVLPMLVNIYIDNSDWHGFFISIIITSFFGGSLMLSNACRDFTLSTRETFIITVSAWLAITLFGSLPFKLSDIDMHFTDAFFESMSGITTTGATVIPNLSEASPGILIWRGLLQWLGGIGIIIMALSVLPILKVGGMQLFRSETGSHEKALPRVTKLSISITLIYTFFTLSCLALYLASGLSPLDAFAHALTTISSGGFSTRDGGFITLDNRGAEFVAFIFMIISGLPFVLFLRASRGDTKALTHNAQARAYITILAVTIVALIFCMMFIDMMPFGRALRYAAFNAVSIMTGTGYSNTNTAAFAGHEISILFFLMVLGGCAGSTTSGLKIFRFQILEATAKTQIQKLVHPNAVFIPRYDGQHIPKDTIMSVLSLFFVFALTFALSTMMLSWLGLDFITALSATAACLSNVGPGFGDIIGANGTYAPLPDAAKWLLSFCMLLGRLELFTVLVLFSPYFWKR